MSAQAWITLAGLVATVIVVPAFRLLIRIDKRVSALCFNHVAHIYQELEKLTGEKSPSMEDLK